MTGALGRLVRLTEKPFGAVLLAAALAGCASVAGGPPRLYPVEEEIGIIRQGLSELGAGRHRTRPRKEITATI